MVREFASKLLDLTKSAEDQPLGHGDDPTAPDFEAITLAECPWVESLIRDVSPRGEQHVRGRCFN